MTEWLRLERTSRISKCQLSVVGRAARSSTELPDQVLFCPKSAEGRGAVAKQTLSSILGHLEGRALNRQLLQQHSSVTRWTTTCAEHRLPAECCRAMASEQCVHRNQSSAANTSQGQTIEPLAHCGKGITNHQSKSAFTMPGTWHPRSRCTHSSDAITFPPCCNICSLLISPGHAL